MQLPLPIISRPALPPFPALRENNALAAVTPLCGVRRGESDAEPGGALLGLTLEDIREAAMARGPICPDCLGRDVVRWGKRNGIQRYRCKPCARCFTEFTGTVLEGLHLRDKFLSFCMCMVEGMTVERAAAKTGISPSTSFAWRHRILSRLEQIDSMTKLSGIVELAQRAFAISFKGSRDIPDYALASSPSQSFPLGLGYSRNPTYERRAWLLVGVDRAGRVRSEVVGARGGKNSRDAMEEMIEDDAVVCAKRIPGFWHPIPSCRMKINWVDTPRKLIRRETRTIHGPLCHAETARSLILRWRNWIRRFCGVATKHMVRYTSWFWRILALGEMATKGAARALFFEILRKPRTH
jgi:transposase-like protein